MDIRSCPWPGIHPVNTGQEDGSASSYGGFLSLAESLDAVYKTAVPVYPAVVVPVLPSRWFRSSPGTLLADPGLDLLQSLDDRHPESKEICFAATWMQLHGHALARSLAYHGLGLLRRRNLPTP